MAKTENKTVATKAKAAKKSAKPRNAATKPAKASARKAAPKAARKPQSPAKPKTSPEKGFETMTANQNKIVNDTIEQMTTASNEAFKEGFEKSLKSVDEINAFAKENVDAVIASATAAGKSAEELNASTVEYAKSSMESASQAAKALTTAKSVQDMIEVQTDYVKSSMDAFLAQVTKTTDLYTGALKEASKPINDRVAASVELVQSAR